MKARVPYLARQADGLSGRGALRPPCEPFAGAYLLTRPPGDDDPRPRAGDAAGRSASEAVVPQGFGEESPAPPWMASERGEDTGADRAGGAPGAPRARAGDAGAQPAPAGPDAPGPGRISPHMLAAAPAERPPGATAPATAPADVARAALALPRRWGDSRPAGGAARARPSPSGPDPYGGMPGLARKTGHGHVNGETAIGMPPGAGEPGPPGRLAEPAVVRHLLPPAYVPLTVTVPGQGVGEPRQRPRGPRPTRLSIGTIEVTVVSPAPAGAAHETRATTQAARSRPRPPSLLAANVGADRLREGLRRWYGTAQG